MFPPVAVCFVGGAASLQFAFMNGLKSTAAFPLPDLD